MSRRFSLIDAVAGRVTKGRLRALARHPLVEHVERNQPIHALNNTAQESFGVTAARTNAPGIDGNADGNVNTYSAADLVAAVIDTGIDADHGDLNEGKVIAFRDFVNNISTPYDDHGHGTHVSGDARRRGRRARGPALPRCGAGRGAGRRQDPRLGRERRRRRTLISALQWVVANKATYGIEVVNLSLGTPGCSDGTDADSHGARGGTRRRARDGDRRGQRGAGPVHGRVARRGAEGADGRLDGRHGAARASSRRSTPAAARPPTAA